MKVLTIIVSYNFMPWIDQCLGSMLRSEYDNDILVVDNASQDETVAVIKERYPMVKLIENGANLGFGKANNIGIQYAMDNGYDGVLLLNEDAWLDENTLGRLVDTAERYADFGIVSPVHLTGDGENLERGFATYAGFHSQHDLPARDIIEVPFINAAIWYIKLDVLRKVGLFDRIFYHYGEDIDLTHRMAFHHFKVGFVPAVFGYHDRQSRKITRAQFFRAERVFHLAEYTNVNYPFHKAFALGVLAQLKKSVLSIAHGRPKDCVTYFAQSFKLMWQTPDVLQSRRLSKRPDLSHYR